MLIDHYPVQPLSEKLPPEADRKHLFLLTGSGDSPSWWQVLEAAGHTASIAQKKREMSTDT